MISFNKSHNKQHHSLSRASHLSPERVQLPEGLVPLLLGPRVVPEHSVPLLQGQFEAELERLGGRVLFPAATIGVAVVVVVVVVFWMKDEGVAVVTILEILECVTLLKRLEFRGRKRKTDRQTDREADSVREKK